MRLRRIVLPVRSSPLLAALALVVGACGGSGSSESVAIETVHPAPGLEADPMAPAVQAEDPASVEAAVDRLLVYIGAHAEGDAQADSLWGPDGVPPDVALDAEPFRQSDVAVVGAVVEEPGAPEGAARSTSLEVPMTLTLRTEAGQSRTARMRYTLRRVNDAEGAEPWSLRWHLASVVVIDSGMARQGLEPLRVRDDREY